MALMLLPRLPATGDGPKLLVWVGATDRTTPPALRWFVNDAPVAPRVVRAMTSIRDELFRELALEPDLLDGEVDGQRIPRTFTGLYELDPDGPDLNHRVRVETDDGVDAEAIDVRSLPDTVPVHGSGRIDVVLASCFNFSEADSGSLRRITGPKGDLLTAFRPCATIFMGDQIYGDLPTLADFPKSPFRLAEKLERDYLRNWRDETGFDQLLRLAPAAFVPDDHEFWNNFPHVSPVIGNSWTEGGRARWRHAALAAFRAFQTPPTGQVGVSHTIEIGEVSIHLADTRSLRREDRASTLAPPRPVDGFLGAHAQLRAWVDEVNARRQHGVFVTGQSLLRSPTGVIKGTTADFELANYGDYPLILQELVRLERESLLVTGDVHWGRVVHAQNKFNGRRIHEVICSPTALVTSVGIDPVKKSGAFLGGLFGRKDPWPRHSDPDDAPDLFAKGAPGGQYECDKRQVFGQAGDQIAVLSFDLSGGEIHGGVTYLPIHPQIREPRSVPLFPPTSIPS
jgi:PhoD-like phosphatase